VAAWTNQPRHATVIAAHLAFARSNARLYAEAAKAAPAALENKLRQQASREAG